MKSFAQSVWKQRCLYFFAGLLLSILCFEVTFHWLAIFYWMDIIPYRAFDSQPNWLKSLNRFIDWLPWIAVAAVLIFRLIKGRSVRIGFFTIGTALPTVVLIGWLLFSVPVNDYIHRQKFDSTLWLNQENSKYDIMWPPRLCMVDDLMSRKILDGLTKSEVIKLLGEHDGKGFSSQITGDNIYYRLGPERSLIGIDYEWLVIIFDNNGKVVSYRIHIT
jgi:hypothetical protein